MVDSTIVANDGPGVDNNVLTTNSNVVFNKGPGIVGGIVSGTYVSGNQGGNLTGGAVGSVANKPVESAPAFLVSVTPDERTRLGVDRHTFRLTFSKPMNKTRPLLVTFGRTSPYTGFILSPSPGWLPESDRMWQGAYSIGGEVGDGTQTLRVMGAVSADGFTIPPDTYHRFVVDTQDGDLSPANGRIIDRGSTRLTIAWDPSLMGGITGYDVTWSTERYGYYEPRVLNTKATILEDTNLSPGVTYYYMVHEHHEDNTSTQLSAPITGTTTLVDDTPTHTLQPTDTLTPTWTFNSTSTPTHDIEDTPTATALERATGTPLPADVNEDGNVDKQDLLLLMQQWHLPDN